MLIGNMTLAASIIFTVLMLKDIAGDYIPALNF